MYWVGNVAATRNSAGQVLAQSAANYPSKPIRYIVGYIPGGTADMLARAVGQKLAETWGQQVIVENRPGAGTNHGVDAAVCQENADIRRKQRGKI
ncbi:MAG: hypothetical protein K2Y16_01740 [Burkholderiales bacterium]|nr:hypothetical protein [Burkholderiales bacterium]